MVEADGQQDTQKALKALSFPVMDDDGLPSGYIQKVLMAVAKWRVKMHAMIETLDSLEERNENLEPLLSSNSVCFDKLFIQHVIYFSSVVKFSTTVEILWS